MCTVIRNAIEACPEITIAGLRDKVHERVSLDVKPGRVAAFLFFHKMVLKELTDMTFTKNKGCWHAKTRKRKRPKKRKRKETEYISCISQWREMQDMYNADLEAIQCRRIWP